MATINYLIVAGGATEGGAGGGGGQVISGSTNVVSGIGYSITVGGASTNSSAFSNTSLAGSVSSSGSGYAGGAGAANANGGGGGDSSVGGDASTGVGGNGGSGTLSSISGSSLMYGGGGGGGAENQAGTGVGGGGNGSIYGNGGNATPNTGGGGGGSYNASGGSGGSGVVIISAAIGIFSVSATTGGTHTQSGGNDIWTFTSSGTWIPVTNAQTFSVADSTVTKDTPSIEELTYYITASSGTNGSISPNGSIFAVTGGNQTFTFTPNAGYAVDGVTIDGVLQPIPPTPPTSYTFTNIIANHTISVTFGVETSVVVDLQCSVTVSGYKWLTSTLQVAQQSYALRPFFKVKAVDDSIVPTSKTIGFVNLRNNGTMAVGPDGTVFAVGESPTSDVMLYKGANLHGGSFDSSVTLESGAGTHDNTLNRYVVKCSDWIKGTYHVDVWYLFNFGNTASLLNVKHFYSDDGGNTWNNETVTGIPGATNTDYQNGTIPNLSICGITPRWDPNTQTTRSGFAYFYPSKNGSGVYNKMGAAQYNIYKVHTYFGDTTNGYVNNDWPSADADSGDWTIHSLDSYRLSGTDNFIISGFRNFYDPANTGNLNYSLWNFEVENFTGGTSDVWSSPISVFSAYATITGNVNSFTYPTANVASTVINGNTIPIANITFNSVVVATTGATGTGTHTDIMLTQTVDGDYFTYPSIFNFNGASFGNVAYTPSYVQQGGYYYLLGLAPNTDSEMWESVVNNIVADISNDVLAYAIQDVSGGASSMSIQLANQNSMWVGTSPTNPGASAIAGGNKILIEQGYYNANGVAETVPRSVFYIDDINQSTTSNNNTVTIAGRDFLRKFSLTITKYAYNIFNSLFSIDMSLANWNQQNDTWQTVAGGFQSTTAPTDDAVITLANMPPNTYGSMMTVSIQGQTTGHAYIYVMYLDANNWARIHFQFNAGVTYLGFEINDHTGLSIFFSTQTSSPLNNNTLWYPVVIRQHNWTQFDVMIGSTGSYYGNDIGSYGSLTYYVAGYQPDLNSMSEMEIWTGLTNPATTSQWSVGLGCKGIQETFKAFRYIQYTDSLSINDVIKTVATKAGIFNYQIQDIVTEYFFGKYTYTLLALYATIVNRQMTIRANGYALADLNAPQIADGEIRAIMHTHPLGANTGFSIAFRHGNDGSGHEGAYRFHLRDENGYQHVYLERLYLGTWYTMAPSPYTTTTPQTIGDLNIDFTKPHEYKVVFIDAWLFLYVDGIEVCGWNDNNATTLGYLTTGQWGWYSDAATTLIVSEMTSTAFWKQNPSLSLNPGDDMLSALNGFLQTVRAWVFSDLFGRLKAVFLNSADPSTYTYQNQIQVQGVDSSDKEYLSQVTVYGNRVSAVARDNTLMSGVPVRDSVIVDYTITTQQDAQNRANYELIHSNQYQAQYSPKQTMNVGAELFDVVTVVDMGSNNTGVNSSSRVYAQKFTLGGKGNNEFSLEVDTGHV